MDRVTKALRKLTKADRARYERITRDVVEDRLAGYDVVKLVGREDVFRLRKGPMRVIFQRKPDQGNVIVAFGRRSERTYKNIE